MSSELFLVGSVTIPDPGSRRRCRWLNYHYSKLKKKEGKKSYSTRRALPAWRVVGTLAAAPS